MENKFWKLTVSDNGIYIFIYDKFSKYKYINGRKVNDGPMKSYTIRNYTKKKLPEFEDNIYRFTSEDCKFISLPKISSNLIEIICKNEFIRRHNNLKKLPNNLLNVRYLYINNNRIKKLPIKMNKIISLEIYNNKLEYKWKINFNLLDKRYKFFVLFHKFTYFGGFSISKNQLIFFRKF